MAVTGDNKLASLRPGRFEGERVLLALAISVLVHVLIWGGYELNRDMHWLPRLNWFAPKTPLVIKMPRYEQPLEFVTVENPSTDVPKNTKYYSNHNSVAANPDANELARKAADETARDFKCGTDTVKVIGKSGRAVELALRR